MNARRIMIIAGEPSGDLLAAELVRALRLECGAGATFFGAGGPQLEAAGVELAFDLTRHAVVGLVEVLAHYRHFKRLFDVLVGLALERQPDLIVCVDFSGFNRRFARQIRWEQQVRRLAVWKPRLVQYVSPQVWASRPGRARAMARDFDLLLAIFPFEKSWYARRAPELAVEFVGHPMLDRYGAIPAFEPKPGESPLVVLLPGSRAGELRRHLPVMFAAFARVSACRPGLRGIVVLPNESLAQLTRSSSNAAGVKIQVGALAGALREATIAVASTGTVTMECAYFQVPTIALYKTSWSTYEIGKRIIQVPYLAMPNLLAGEQLFPEFIQHQATAENIADAMQTLLQDEGRRQEIRRRLAGVVATLGGPGASVRAAKAIARLAGVPLQP